MLLNEIKLFKPKKKSRAQTDDDRFEQVKKEILDRTKPNAEKPVLVAPELPSNEETKMFGQTKMSGLRSGMY